MKTKGRFIFKSTWYSFCSKHIDYDKNCHICESGVWQNDIIHNIGNLLFTYFPGFWIFWNKMF
jgi:hypothetical protein